MHMIQNALKIQQQVFGMFQGFSEEVISSIPIFEYNRGLTDEEMYSTTYPAAYPASSNLKRGLT